MATVNKDFVSRNGVQGTVLKSTITTGTAPLQVASTTLVSNLNADTVDGVHASAFGLLSGHLGQFASTTSAQLAGVMSDETGTDKLVFNTSPTFVTSLLTSSASFDLLNTTATTINFGGAATTLNIGNASGTVVVAGNLTVNGTTNTINSTTITVDDKNIELGSVTSPNNTTADGGGITLKGATDKTFNWVNSTSAWTSSEHMDLASGKAYYINGTSVLNSTTLGSGVVTSSLTAVGTITTGTWSATTIATNKGGTGLTSFTSGGAVYATSTSVLTTGTLPVTAGGTGVATLAAGYMKSNGTSAFTSVTSIPGSDISGAITGVAGGLAMSYGDVTSKTVTVVANSTPTTIDSFAVATSTTAKYLLQMKQGTKMTTTTVVVAWDGTDVQVAEYGVVDATAGAANATVTATHAAGTVTVSASSSDAATTNVVCKAIVTYIDA